MSNILLKNDDYIPKIEYRGTWKLLDMLIKKIEATDNYEDCKNYCELYKMIYELLGKNNENN